MVKIDDSEKKLFDKGVIKVPVALLGVFMFMTAQTFAGIWWASATTTTQSGIQTTLAEIKEISKNNAKDRYTSIDAKNDFASVSKDMGLMQAQYTSLNDRVNKFQSRYEPTLIKLENKFIK